MMCGWNCRDLPRTRPASLSARQFPENLRLGQAKISIKIFQFWPFGDNNQIFSSKTILKDIAELLITFFDTVGYQM